MVCPWYAYSQTMISEVSPLPQLFLFFALFSVVNTNRALFSQHAHFLTEKLQVGKTSAFIGPLVSSAIITASGNNDNMPFAFLFALYVPFLHLVLHAEHSSRVCRGTLSTGFLWFVDIRKSRMECEEFVAAEAKREAFNDALEP